MAIEQLKEIIKFSKDKKAATYLGNDFDFDPSGRFPYQHMVMMIIYMLPMYIDIYESELSLYERKPAVYERMSPIRE